MGREVARKFNQPYSGVSPETPDPQHMKAGGLFPIFEPLIGRVERLIGTGGPGPDGRLLRECYIFIG
jgi:tryptophanyl-tRNA synthetase